MLLPSLERRQSSASILDISQEQHDKEPSIRLREWWRTLAPEARRAVCTLHDPAWVRLLVMMHRMRSHRGKVWAMPSFQPEPFVMLDRDVWEGVILRSICETVLNFGFLLEIWCLYGCIPVVRKMHLLMSSDLVYNLYRSPVACQPIDVTSLSCFLIQTTLFPFNQVDRVPIMDAWNLLSNVHSNLNIW